MEKQKTIHARIPSRNFTVTRVDTEEVDEPEDV
jgi:hypothetical protein